MKKILTGLFNDRRFLLCVIVLAVAAAGIQTVATRMRLHFRKLPVPLRKELSEFDTTTMAPYKLVGKSTLDSDIEEALGTKEYLQFFFEDTSLDEKSPGKYLNFFVTYYTGDPDQVPHVPDVCYVGGGNEMLSNKDLTIDIPGIGLKNDTLPLRRLMFRDHNLGMGSIDKPVVYFFHINGKYEPNRMRTRLHLADLRQKYCYFSKVELAFYRGVQPDAEQVLEVARKFFKRALPILIRDHWPVWEQVIAEPQKK